MRFKCEAKYIDLNNFPMEFSTDVAKEPEMVHSDAVVHYVVDIDACDEGIKYIDVSGRKIEVKIGDYELCIHQYSHSTIDGNDEDEWEVEEYVDLSNGHLFPRRVELDWESKKAYIHFE